MKNVGRKLDRWKFDALSPNNDFIEAMEHTHDEFRDKWKIFVLYPKDFTFVCPTEIVEYSKLTVEFAKRDACLFVGSTDNIYAKLAWKQSDAQLKNTLCWWFADNYRYGKGGLVEELEAFDEENGCAPRLTVILDMNNIIRHTTMNDIHVGRNAEETLRVLDALQTGENTACNRPIGGETLS